jgi:S-adenosylmethionine-diacylgycerolhomoserine-N-methlytransferase
MEFLKSLINDFKVIYFLIKPTQGNTQKERLESFYSRQADNYDAFRKRLLKGREQLFDKVSADKSGVWIDMGGGTGANFESVRNLADFRKIYIVDLSPSLLAVARKRIADNKWRNVEVVEEHSSTFVPQEGLADIITFSYSLTMMPDWFAVIDHAKQLLKPGGIIGVVDFYVSGKHPQPGFHRHTWLVRTFWQTWFAMDNVFLSPEHLAYLDYHFERLDFLEDMATLPFPPLGKAPYYLFIGSKQSKPKLNYGS